MNTLPGLAIYHPNRLDPDAFLAGFVARVDLADFLLDKLRNVPPDGVAEHQLVVGQRGMGKTSLLRRLAIGISRDAELSKRYIPLTFREEQYNVRSLAQLWRNCEESLAEWCESAGKNDIAAEIDRSLSKPAWRESRAAAEAFLAAAKSLGGRPILFVDNLDLILDALPADEHWVLRHTLQAPGGPILYGAATQLIRQSGDRSGAFYEFFYPHLLHPLSGEELLRCLRKIADMRGDAGKRVRDILAREPERLRTLHRLTGGNPRVLALVYQLLERTESDTVFSDLEVLLDQLTPFYKARVEEYRSELQRAVIDAIALHWDPVISHDLAKTTDVEITTISSQLTRFKNDGLIEEVPTSGARSGYQLVERFFNIWYLMRHGTRRTRQKALWLTVFLRDFYAPDELKRMKLEADIAGQAGRHPLYREALFSAVESFPPLKQLNAPERANIEPLDKGKFEVVPDLSQSGAIEPGSARALVNVGVHLGDLGRGEEEIAAYDNVVARFATASEPALREQVARALVNKGYRLGALGRGEEAIAVYDDVVARFATASEPALRERVAWALINKGYRLGALGRGEEAIAVYDDVVARFATASEPALREQVARALVNKGVRLGALGRGEEAIAVYDDVVARFATASEPALREQVARALVNKGYRLGALGRGEEAIAVYDDVVARFATASEPALREPVARALVNKGASLGALGRGEEEIAVYDDVVARFATASEPALREPVARALFNKSDRLGKLARFEEALAACRHAIEVQPDNAEISITLGNLLADQFGRFDEAEVAYRNALRNANDELMAKANLGWLFINSGRIADAKTMRSSLETFEPVGLALLDAAFEIAVDNLGAATKHLNAALEGDQQVLVTTFSDDLLRLLRLAQAHAFGEKLIDWLNETRYAERYAPIYAAFVAYVRGKRFLLDVSPEVRAPAEQIYGWLVGHESTPQPAPKQASKPKRRRGRRPKR